MSFWDARNPVFAFVGMNNVTDPSKLGEGFSPALINVDADDTEGVYQRPLNPYTGEAALPLECFYHGRTYTADAGEVLYGSSIESASTRELGGLLAEFDSPVTMLAAMVDGIFIGTQDEVVFVSGGDPALGDMQMRQVHSYGVTEGTCCKVENNAISEKGAGYAIIFLSHNGICYGGNGGAIENATDGIVAIPKCLTGSATLRTEDNRTYYVVQLGGQAGTPDQYTPITPTDIQ